MQILWEYMIGRPALVWIFLGKFFRLGFEGWAGVNHVKVKKAGRKSSWSRVWGRSPWGDQVPVWLELEGGWGGEGGKGGCRWKQGSVESCRATGELKQRSDKTMFGFLEDRIKILYGQLTWWGKMGLWGGYGMWYRSKMMVAWSTVIALELERSDWI